MSLWPAIPSPEKARSATNQSLVVKRKSSASDDDDDDHWCQTSQLLTTPGLSDEDDHECHLNNAFSSSSDQGARPVSWFDANIKNRRFLSQFSSLRPQKKAVVKNELESNPMDLCIGTADQATGPPVKSKRKKYLVKKISSGEQPSAKSSSVLNSCLTSLLALRNKADSTLDSIL